MNKLIIGKKYEFKTGQKLYLEYDGDNCYGDFCSLCGEELKKGFCFANSLDGDPQIREIYGSECIKKVLKK